MIKFRNFDQIEHKYAFEDAVVGADTFNGAFGAVTSGTFAVAEDGTKVIMQAEDGDKIFVSDVYDVPDDVDNSTGDIEFNGSVVVHGNVRTGFCIKCGGNIEVYGVVEGADLDAGGDIILHRGVQGMSRCQIHAVDVALSFADGAVFRP